MNRLPAPKLTDWLEPMLPSTRYRVQLGAHALLEHRPGHGARLPLAVPEPIAEAIRRVAEQI